MTTFVGTQTNFADALRELVELDYDAIEAYETAITRLDNEEFRKQFQNFKEDHERHVTVLNGILVNHSETKVEGPSLKKYLTSGKIVLAGIVGDNSILQAMLTNEDDTNTAYKKVSDHKDIWDDARDAVAAGFEDEKRHKQWIKDNIT